ncbi:MAG: thrombospondin type 3 repeat-containing protein [Patescibacteria group bacterium]
MSPENQTGQSNSWQLGLGAVAILALVLGVWQIRNSISAPFAFVASSDANQTNQPPKVSDDIEALKTKDNDTDGLSDYDEIYLYQTSPYLKDSDSDGISDKTEVERGTDPNCPTGKNCGPVQFQPTAAVDNNPLNLGNALAPTPEQIRAYLKQSGATDSLLASYSDQQLLDLYKQVAGEVAPQPASAPPTAGEKISLKPEEKAALQKMTPAEIRQFLIKSGVKADELNKIDDVTLKAMVEQIINGQ